MTATNYSKQARLMLPALILAAVLLFALPVYADGGEDEAALDPQSPAGDSTSTEIEAPDSESDDNLESESTDDSPVAEDPSEEVVEAPDLDSDCDLPDENVEEAVTGEPAEATVADDSASDQTDCVEEDAAQVAGGDDVPEALEDREEGQETASDSDGVGNSYVASVIPEDGVVNVGSPTNFTVTFTEVGAHRLGSAQLFIPNSLIVDVDADLTITGNWDVKWEVPDDTSIFGKILSLWAKSYDDRLGQNGSVSAHFTATADVSQTHLFDTLAWTVANDDYSGVFNGDGNRNSRAEGYDHPRVNVWVDQAESNVRENGTDTTVGLADVGDNLNWHYVQTADIDLDEDPFNDVAGWEPIGEYSSDPFTGAYNGSGYSISNLFIDRTADYIGLFGYTNGAILTNIHLQNISVSGRGSVGGLVGRSDSTIITNCSAEGVVNSTGGVGDVGGLIGSASGGSITASFADVKITATEFQGHINNVGGLVGRSSSDITDCYATGAVAGVGSTNWFGGLVGNSSSDITDSYATGAVTSTSTGTVVGGLVGNNTGAITNSYYNSETSGQSETGKGEPRTTAQMTGGVQSDDIFTGWDTSIWQFEEGLYPRLINNLGPALPAAAPVSGAPGSGGFTMPAAMPGVSLGFTPMALTGVPFSNVTATTMVFPAEDGSASLINAQFLANASFFDLGALISLYNELLKQLAAGESSMGDREYAQTVIELALGRAAIMVIDARLQQETGSGFLASAVVDAYQYAQAQLAAYGGYLSGAQRDAANAVLNSLAQAIRALGIEL